jgi:hypothetical protein
MEKHKTQKQRLFQRRLEGEMLSESLGRFSNLSNITTIDTTMKRK